ncbi:MAG: antibiotic biosynthesis monooxygenase [Fuerstiella sp.]
MTIATTSKPPYYSVIFTSHRTTNGSADYAKTAARMIELAEQQAGYLGVESVRDESGFGITVSYWVDEDSIRKWYAVAEHKEAQANGRDIWYESFCVRVCKVEREYGMAQPAGNP